MAKGTTNKKGLPIKKWTADPKSRFVNPYNFVRLSSGPVARASTDEGGRLWGRISCTLRTRTPLGMPDAGSKQEGSKQAGSKQAGSPEFWPFFRANYGERGEQLAIPGSEIRGVIRSAFEALDNACLSVNNDNTLSSRHPIARKPGLLVFEKKKWVLYSATCRAIIKIDHITKNIPLRTWLKAPSYKVHCNKVTAYRKLLLKAGKLYPGEILRIWPVLLGGGLQPFAFGKQNPLAVSGLEEAVAAYEENLSIYKKNNPDNEMFYEDVRPKRDGSYTPLFYEEVSKGGSKLVYLSPAQISRSVYHNTVSNLLGDHARCTDPDQACEGCRLFGLVGPAGARASKLRFTDAVITHEGTTERRILKELASPKPSAVEFYTERPKRPRKALVWTYDYMVTGYNTKSGNPTRELLIGSDSVMLRGRKFYLHCRKSDDEILSSCSQESKALVGKAAERTIETELLRSGSEFCFDVYFEGITREQLDKLVWTLCIGENSLDGAQMHKIGCGKPLGLGSVKVRVDSVVTRSSRHRGAKPARRSVKVGMDSVVTRSSRHRGANSARRCVKVGVDFVVTRSPVDVLYTVRDVPVKDCLLTNHFNQDEAFQDFMVITNFELAKGFDVSYPKGDDGRGKPNSRASHQWFAGNKTMGSGGGGALQPSIGRVLPMLPEKAANGWMLLLPELHR